MAWIARDKDGHLGIWEDEPVFDGFMYYREGSIESEDFMDFGVQLPSDADEKLIGRHIPVEI